MADFMAEFVRDSSESGSDASGPSPSSDGEDSENESDVDAPPWHSGMIPRAEVPEAFSPPDEGSRGPRNALSGSFWENSKQATLRKMALDCAKAGYVHKLNQMLAHHDPALLLLPSSNAQVGPQLSLLAAAQASGNPDAIELVEEAATRLLFSQLRLIGNGWGEGTSDASDFVQRCLQAGADPSRPQGSHGLRPLQHLCQLSMEGLAASFTPKLVQRRVAQAAAQLAEAAPMVLILAFEQGGRTMIPLEAAAKNEDFGMELVPVLSSALGRLLLQSPALAAAPLVRQAVASAEQRGGEHPAVEQLVSLLRKAQPCLDQAMENTRGRKSIWEPNCAYEAWFLRQRRLQILEPLVSQVDQADSECQKEEALQKLAEVEVLLEKRRRQHSAQIAELQMALDKAQRAAEEASARANEAVRLNHNSTAKAAVGDSAASQRRTDSAPSFDGGEGSASPTELLQRIRQQRGLDIDYSGLPKSVEQSALAMQRSIGAAVERLAVDLYASRGHFLLELIQNADDNRYRDGDDPQLSLHLDCAQDGSLFFASINNELGMNSKDVEALCDINRSTKPAQEGKIGKKGVGWKAIFAVSDQPTVLSGPFRFSFDVRRRGRLGYVTPDELSLEDFQALPQLLREADSTGCCNSICVFVEADCLLKLAVACRGFVARQVWEYRVQRFWPSLWEHCEKSWPAWSSETVAKMAFQALYAGALGKVSPVDAAMARKVARGVESRAEMPQNLVMFTLYHRSSMLGRACSSITPVRTETLPLSLAAEKAHFSLELPPTLPELLDEWLFRFICNGRGINRQLLVSSEVSNPDILQTLELSVVPQIWVWDSGLQLLNVLSPKMPLRLVSQDRQGFQLHFVHLPFDEADFSNCISLTIDVKTAAKDASSSKDKLEESGMIMASATLQGRSGCKSHHQLLFDGYLRALNPIIPRVANKTELAKHSGA